MVLAFEGQEYALKSWQPTIDYLQKHILEKLFKLIVVESINVARLESLVANNTVDFVITQPINYVDLELLYGAVGLLTLVDKSKYAKFGSVIFSSKKQQTPKLSYVKNRTIAGASPKGLGG